MVIDFPPPLTPEEIDTMVEDGVRCQCGAMIRGWHCELCNSSHRHAITEWRGVCERSSGFVDAITKPGAFYGAE